MSQTSSSAPPDAAYYQAVEDFFVSRRGAPLFLSSADWVLVDRWRRSGIPLRIVLRGIADALDAHAHSWSRNRPVGSLRYCAAEVEVARERWEQALSQHTPAEVEVAAALDRLAEQCGNARGPSGPVSETLATTAIRLRDRARSPGPQGELESWLAEREAEVREAIVAETDPQRLAAIEAEAAAVLEPYRARMPGRIVAQLQADGIARRLLESRGLPRLSLLLA